MIVLLLLIIPAISMVVRGSVALVFTLLNFIHLLWIMIVFDPSGTTYQFEYGNILALDGISLW